MFSHVDINNFYVSCERLFDPSLKGKPVIVSSNNDGCAVSRSDEAKALGVQMGTPIFMIRDLIKQHDIKVFSSNYTLYQDMSERVMITLRTFVPRMENYSIDEAFLDMSEMDYADPLELGLLIKKTIMQNLGMPVCVGIAATKTLAKMANRYAKKKHKDLGVHWLANEHLVNQALEFTEVGDIWGIGRQYTSLLKGHGYVTAADVVNADDQWIRKKMSVVGERMLNELRGMPCIKWEYAPPVKKNISTTRSFGTLMTKPEPIRQAISNYTAICAQKLREDHTCARKILVFLETNVHRVNDDQLKNSICMELPVATNSTSDLINKAMECFEKIFQPGYKYNKAGVIMIDLIPEDQIQYSLFDDKDFEKARKINKALDSINGVLGKDTVRYATQGYDKPYQVRADHLSKCYTTRLSDLAIIKK